MPYISNAFTLFLVLFTLMNSAFADAQLNLTEQEQSWLSQNKRSVVVGVAIIPPYLSNLDKKSGAEGLSLDYLRLIEENLDTDFQYRIFDNYGAMIQAAKQREIDIVFAVSKNGERSEYLDFTPVYSHLANKIFTRKGYFDKAEMTDFVGKRFAVPRGTALVSYISGHYPGIELVQVKSLRDAFSLLAAGDVDGVGSYASAGYFYTRLEGIENVSIVGNVGYDYHISFGSRNDWPLLGQVLNKGLAEITSAQRKQLEERWVQPEDSQRVDLATVVQLSIYIGFALLLAGFLVVLLWNRSLKREMAIRLEAQKEVRFLAYHDELTSVYNRQFFVESLAEFTRLPCNEAMTSSIILLGLDNFSLINDFHGHKMGDQILQRVSLRLPSRLSNGAVLARTGGDEFAILLRQSSNRIELGHLADLLITEVKRPIVYGNQSVAITATAGISVQTEALDDPMRLMEQADIALHEAKRKNIGGYLFYAHEMSETLLESKQLAEALIAALNSDQFYLNYQPQVSLSSRKVIGFEALARWNHPVKGNIPPDQFIALAEREGIIVTLGDRVLQLACDQAVKWLREGIEFDRIAVNVSVKQFVETDFVSKVMNALSLSGLPANKLELEITESLFLGDKKVALETMDKLTSQGVRFSIDDFGTGFSSLLYLKELPVAKLKLDQGFIRGITTDHSSLQIVKASLQMGQALNMAVIAEGVETLEEQRLLVQLNCGEAQGYLFSRPVAGDKVNADLMEAIAHHMTPVT